MKSLPVRKETSARSLREIKRNVKSMLREALEGVDVAVDRCRAAGIVDDHENALGPFVIPRDFLVAYCRDIAVRYGLQRGPGPHKKRSDNYYEFI